MPWFQVDDQLGFHPKAITAGNAAMGLWVRAGSWCALHFTEGFVPSDIARSMGTAAQIKRLVDAGLWTASNGGYRFHQWGDRQLSKEKIEERRRKRVDAGRKGGQRSGESRRGSSKDGSNAEANASAEATASAEAEAQVGTEADAEQMPQQNQTPVLVPVLSGGYVEGGSLVANARENEPPPPHCDQHPGGTPQPCGACADARKRWAASKLERDELAEAAAAERAARERAAKHEAAELRARAVATCDICDDEGYHRRHVCTHDPEIENAGSGKLRAAYEAERAKAAVPASESEEAHA